MRKMQGFLLKFRGKNSCFLRYKSGFHYIPDRLHVYKGKEWYCKSLPIADFRYDDYDVPDTMNVHGIYDTKASMVTFESRSEFQSFLQAEAGISGSYFGFHAGVKSAWGESKSGSSQTYMALLSVDINR